MPPNILSTERRDYGVGRNEKGHAALTKRPNKGSEDDRLTAETGEEREARLQQMRDCCYVCS